MARSIRSNAVMGLIMTPELGSNQVSSLEVTFEPSIGIMARKVDKLGMDIRSFREPLRRAIKEVVIPSIAMNFQKYGRPRWANLSPETEKQRLYEGSGWAILDRTGALKNTMKQIGIWHIDREKAIIANLPEKVWYGVVHQGGAKGSIKTVHVRNVGAQGIQMAHSQDITEGDGSIPARPFVVLQPEDEHAIDEVFLNWLDERMIRVGLPPTSRSMMASLF